MRCGLALLLLLPALAGCTRAPAATMDTPSWDEAMVDYEMNLTAPGADGAAVRDCAVLIARGPTRVVNLTLEAFWTGPQRVVLQWAGAERFEVEAASPLAYRRPELAFALVNESLMLGVRAADPADPLSIRLRLQGELVEGEYLRGDSMRCPPGIMG